MGHSSQPPEDSTPSAEELKKAEAKRQQQLFDWANDLLKKLGAMQQLSQSSSLDGCGLQRKRPARRAKSFQGGNSQPTSCVR